MLRSPAPGSPLRLVLLLVALVSAPVAAQTSDPVEAALDANRSDPAIQACLKQDSDVDYYQRALMAIDRARDPNVPGKWICSGIGASWQEGGPPQCCAAFERDKGRNVDAAWTALQVCGWQAEAPKRKPAYLAAVQKCLKASGKSVVATPPPAATTPSITPEQALSLYAAYWSLAQLALEQQKGQDAFLVKPSGGAPTVVDNRGTERPMPGFLSERLHGGPPFGILDEGGAISEAFRMLHMSEPRVLQLLREIRQAGRPSAWGAEYEYIQWRDDGVGQFVPDTSLLTAIGILLASSEHGSIRGTINGGGDFLDEQGAPPPQLGMRLPRAQPRMVLASWTVGGSEAFPRRAYASMTRAFGVQAPAPAGTEIVLRVPAATVTSPRFARVVSDVSWNGVSALSVISGTAVVRERTTGRQQQVGAGEFVVVVPGTGVSAPMAIPPPRLAAMRAPLSRGTIQLRPGQAWSGTIALGPELPIEARLPWKEPAGGAYALEVTVNGTRVTDALRNKTSPFRFADGRNYPYREPNSSRWMLFYSADWAANNSTAGGGYEVQTDRGQAYRYVWDIRKLLGGRPTAQVQFRNMLDSSGPTLELRLLASGEAAGSIHTGTTPDVPGTTVPQPVREERPGFGGGTSTQGGPHLAVYAPAQMVGHTDWSYPVVVQLQDGNGRPMYPASDLAVTVSSSNPAAVRLYGGSSSAATTVTLRAPDRSGKGGKSWDNAAVVTASTDGRGGGSATISASASGVGSGSVSVTMVPRPGTEWSSWPVAARMSFMVFPPVVETDRQPLAVIDLLDAQGRPTGIDHPGGWSIQSSNPGVLAGWKSSGSGGQIGYGLTPGEVQLTLVPGNSRLTGGTAALRVISPQQAVADESMGRASRVAPPVLPGGDEPPVRMRSPAGPGGDNPASAPMRSEPPRSGAVVRNPDFGEPAVQGTVSNIVTARAVQNGAPVGISDRFTPDVNPIHIWFNLAGFAPGTVLTSRWTYLGGTEAIVIGTAEFETSAANDHGTFSYELAPDKRWPAGRYRAEILRGEAVVGSTFFTVGPTQ